SHRVRVRHRVPALMGVGTLRTALRQGKVQSYMSSVQGKHERGTGESGNGFVRDMLHVSEISTLAELAVREARGRFGILALALSWNTERIHADGRSDSQGCHPPGLIDDPAVQ